MIAGETSKAYDEIVTISIVSCRAIGIGAYLLRLGQRVIQIENSHIVLTGYKALNAVLGREVYASNNQLGGIQIMHNNGISHATDARDLDGLATALRWLSYCPKYKGAPLPMLPAPLPDPATEKSLTSLRRQLTIQGGCWRVDSRRMAQTFGKVDSSTAALGRK